MKIINNKTTFTITAVVLLIAIFSTIVFIFLPQDVPRTKNLSVQERLTSGYWYLKDPMYNNIFQVSECSFFDDGTFRLDNSVISPSFYERTYKIGTYTIEENEVTLTLYENDSPEETFLRVLTYSKEYDTFIWTEEVEHQNIQKAINSPVPLTYDEITELVDTHQFYLDKNDTPVFENAPITKPEELIVPAVNFYKYGHCCDVKTITDEKTLNQLNSLIPKEYKDDSFEVQEVLCKTCRSKEDVMAHIENCVVTEKPADLSDDWYRFDDGILEHKLKGNQIINHNNKTYLVVSESDIGKNYNKYNAGVWDSFDVATDDIFYAITLYSMEYFPRTDIYVTYIDDTFKIVRMYEYVPEE